MKKSWIYVVLIIALAVGVFYLVLEKKEPVDPNTENNVSQGEVDKEEPDTSKKPQKEESKDDEFVEAPEDNTPSETPELGRPLPDFTLKNLNGEDVILSDREGKIVLVNFWASWCTWCDKEMPDLQKLKEENDDLLVLAVNVDETKEVAQKYITDGGYDFEVLLDEGGTVAAQYLVSGLPASYFTDKDGTFVGRVPSAITYEQMNEILEDIRSQ